MGKSISEFAIALVIIVFSLWQTSYSQWVLLVAGIVLAIHSLSCQKCFCREEMKSKKKR